MPTLRERRQDATRQDIIRAGMKVFSRRGFQAATVNEIAREAGISRATYYLYFKGGKSELSVEIGTQGGQAYLDVLSELRGLDRPDLADIRAWIGRFALAWKKYKTANALGLRSSVSSAVFSEQDIRIIDENLSVLDPLIGRYPEAEREAVRARFLVLLFQLTFTMFEMFERKLSLDNDSILDALAVMWHREVSEAWLT
jgi:AcrR family transcriptional regulator